MTEAPGEASNVVPLFTVGKYPRKIADANAGARAAMSQMRARGAVDIAEAIADGDYDTVLFLLMEAIKDRLAEIEAEGHS